MIFYFKGLVLIVFVMISLKWIKSATNFCWLKAGLCLDYIWSHQDLLIALGGRLEKIVKGFKNLKKQVI